MGPKVLYRTHKCPPPVPILSQLHPIPTTPSYFLNIHLNIILSSTSGSPQWPTGLQLVKKFPTFLWNSKVLYRTHKCPPPVPILSQLHPVPTTPSNFLKINLNIILPSTSGPPQWSLSLWALSKLRKLSNSNEINDQEAAIIKQNSRRC
jgi:hypothetical protein